ncbi:hypothetical protein UFOVP831_56 [uncultured Caudovirales phage]|uniref:Uncharacterized protein n=1 Tax=uncultured Caudovirales phage TaxID=2100421 RepID=A0A6J5P0I7_9CAUD|nr:hypothetical protein UFOVP831_56 [uncultured Caudovirales phage]
MKILKIILIGICSFAFSYCLTAFCHADFNFKNWESIDRFFTEMLAIGIWAITATCPLLYRD